MSVRCKTRTLFRFCGFFEAVADGEAEAGRWSGSGQRMTVTPRRSSSRRPAKRVWARAVVVVKGVPAEDFDVAVVDGPVLREHDANFFFICDELVEAVVEFGFGVDEDEAGTGGVVADAYAGGGEALGFGWGCCWRLVEGDGAGDGFEHGGGDGAGAVEDDRGLVGVE